MAQGSWKAQSKHQNDEVAQLQLLLRLLALLLLQLLQQRLLQDKYEGKTPASARSSQSSTAPAK